MKAGGPKFCALPFFRPYGNVPRRFAYLAKSLLFAKKEEQRSERAFTLGVEASDTELATTQRYAAFAPALWAGAEAERAQFAPTT